VVRRKMAREGTTISHPAKRGPRKGQRYGTSGLGWLRTKRGFTQWELAEMLGCSTQHLAHVEAGTSWASDSMIEKWSLTMRIPLAQARVLFGKAWRDGWYCTRNRARLA
jgi:DNA-binding XRE family transcriptional regulator